MAPIGVWNQTNLHENPVVRSVAALPFLVPIVWCFLSTHSLGFNTIITQYLSPIVLLGRLRSGAISLPALDKFLDVKALDFFRHPATVAFSPSTLSADPIGWYQTFNFLVDYSLLYCIWLFESARKSSERTPASFPVIFGLLAQVFGIGVLAPLYYFLHYVNAPLSGLASPEARSFNAQSSRAIFLTVSLFSYLPLSLMFLSPSPTVRNRWTEVWQIFPLSVSVAQYVRTRISSHTSLSEQEKPKASPSDRTTIQGTISAFAAISAGVWIYTLLSSPYPLTTIFLPKPTVESPLVPMTRIHSQVNHLSATGSSLLWLIYLFADLKNAQLVHKSWVFLLCTGCLTAMCFGPGVAVAAGWYWREGILEPEGEVQGTGDGRRRKMARQSLDEICFGGGKGRFKVL